MRKLLFSALTVILAGCASSGTKPLIEESVHPFFQGMEENESGVQTLRDGSTYSEKICLSEEDAEREKLNDRCFMKKCHRQGNSQKCESTGDSRIPEIRKRLESERTLENISQAELTEKNRNACLKGDLQNCFEWISKNSYEEEDPITLVCKNKKLFDCQMESEPLKVDQFLPECVFQEDLIRCEEGQEDKFWKIRISRNTKSKRK